MKRRVTVTPDIVPGVVEVNPAGTDAGLMPAVPVPYPNVLRSGFGRPNLTVLRLVDSAWLAMASLA